MKIHHCRSVPESEYSDSGFSSCLGRPENNPSCTGIARNNAPALAAFFFTVTILAMKSHTKYLTFQTKKRRDYLNITDEVAAALRDSGIQEGFALVSAMHITASVYVNDAEDGLIQDIDEWLERLAPMRSDYRHHRTGEDNGDAHLKNLLMHHQVLLPVTGGALDLGTWQQVYYAEFDGQRRKRVIIKIIGE
jgi:secondary thiamine-phosphate synthase enzyme